MLAAGLHLVVDDAPRLNASTADRVQSEVDDARRSKAAIRSHAALTHVCRTIDRMDPSLVGWIESGEGTASAIRTLLQECIDHLAALDERRKSVAAVAERVGLVHTLLLQLDGVGVGTLRMLRLTAVNSIERAALDLLETLPPIHAASVSDSGPHRRPHRVYN